MIAWHKTAKSYSICPNYKRRVWRQELKYAKIRPFHIIYFYCDITAKL